MPKHGDMRIWWLPQIQMQQPFYVPVDNVHEAAKILGVLARYDLFQFEHKVKPDYCNTGDLERFIESADGEASWEGWYDELTGIDDVAEYVEKFPRADTPRATE